jgi:hypothetical protein
MARQPLSRRQGDEGQAKNMIDPEPLETLHQRVMAQVYRPRHPARAFWRRLLWIVWPTNSELVKRIAAGNAAWDAREADTRRVEKRMREMG